MKSRRDMTIAGRERDIRREQRRNAKIRGIPYPHLRTIGQVILPGGVPIWAIPWAMPGLTLTDTTIWLSKKYARNLFKRSSAEGLNPSITYTAYRPCKICKRLLLGLDAEIRWEFDRKFEGHRIACGPGCTETQWEQIEARKPRGVTLDVATQKRNGKAR